MIFALGSHGIIWGLHISNHMRQLPSLRQSLNNKAMQPYLSAFAWRQNNKKESQRTSKKRKCLKKEKKDRIQFTATERWKNAEKRDNKQMY